MTTVSSEMASNIGRGPVRSDYKQIFTVHGFSIVGRVCFRLPNIAGKLLNIKCKISNQSEWAEFQFNRTFAQKDFSLSFIDSRSSIVVNAKLLLFCY